MHNTIDKILAQLMSARSVKQIELSRETGVKQFTISRILHPSGPKGIKEPTDKQVRPLAEYFGVSTDQMRGHEPIPELTFDDALSLPKKKSEPGKPTGLSSADLVRQMLDKHGKGLSDDARRKIVDAVETEPSVKLPTNVIQGSFAGSTVLKGDTLIIAQYDVRGAMGGGQVPAEYREFVRNLVVDKVQLDDLGLKYTSPTNLKIITGWGQSMLGTIEDKSPLIVDIGVTEFVEEGVYAFTWLNHFFIKRVQLLDAEHFQIVSDNKAFEPQKARMEDVYFQAKVLGAWNFRKL